MLQKFLSARISDLSDDMLITTLRGISQAVRIGYDYIASDTVFAMLDFVSEDNLRGNPGIASAVASTFSALISEENLYGSGKRAGVDITSLCISALKQLVNKELLLWSAIADIADMLRVEVESGRNVEENRAFLQQISYRNELRVETVLSLVKGLAITKKRDRIPDPVPL